MLQLIEGYPLKPGCCWLCKTAAQGPVIDTGREIDEEGWEGRMYLCRDCGSEVGRLFGMVPDSKHRGVKAENRRLRTKVEELEERVTQLGTIEAAVNALLPDPGPISQEDMDASLAAALASDDVPSGVDPDGVLSGEATR